MAKKHKFVAKIALKGKFEPEGVEVDPMADNVNIDAGTVATTEDEKLYNSLIEQGYAKKYSAKDSDDDGVAATADSAPKVQKAGGEVKK